MLAQAIATFFRWIMGEAPEGQRKLVFGARVEIMLFVGLLVTLLGGPPNPDIVGTLTGAMVAVAWATIGGNGVEWAAKAFSGKKAQP